MVNAVTTNPIVKKKIVVKTAPTVTKKVISSKPITKTVVSKTGVKKILVVDDEEDIRNSIKIILEKEGYSVSLAIDGKNALQILQKDTFNILIFDVMMPEMSGWDLMTETLKKYPQYRNKIIFLSVVEVSEDRKRELLEQGVLDYITKPFEIVNFTTKIKGILK